MSRLVASEAGSQRRSKSGRAKSQRSASSGGSIDVVSLQPPTQRRRSWVVAGVLMVALAGLLGAWLYSVSTDTIRVVTAAHDLAPGEVLGPDDIRVVEVGRTTELQFISAAQQDIVVGRAARAVIPAGTVLNTGLFTNADEVIPDGHVVVGVTLNPGAVPVSGLNPGDTVAVYSVVSAVTGETSSQRVGDAMVWNVSNVEERAGVVLVSLLVTDELAEPVAAAAGTESVRLGLLP